VAQRDAPNRIRKGFLGLEAQAVARHDPADPLDGCRGDQAGGGKDGEEGLASPRRHGRQDVGDAARLAARDRRDEVRKSALVGSQRPLLEWGHRSPSARKSRTPQHASDRARCESPPPVDAIRQAIAPGRMFG
jgi:hypothetical protein